MESKRKLTVMKKNVSTAAISAHGAPDRRIAVERRQFSYADCIPERRSGLDRRGLFSVAHRDVAIAGRVIEANRVCQ